MPRRSEVMPAFDRPLEVEIIDGDVVITGPGRFCGSFTPAAAQESARRLARAVNSDPPYQNSDPPYQKPLG